MWWHAAFVRGGLVCILTTCQHVPSLAPSASLFVQVDVLVFGHLLQGRFPTLWRHLQALEVDAGSVTMHWWAAEQSGAYSASRVHCGVHCGVHSALQPAALHQPPHSKPRPRLPPPCPPRRFLCCFLNSLPLDSALRVWDLLFFEGSAVVLFRVALALIEIYDQVGRGARWAAPELGGWV